MSNSQAKPQDIAQLQEELSKILDPAVKLQIGIAFMENALYQQGDLEKGPHFKNFWDSRKLCSELFRANLIPTLRTELWTKFCELTQEARRLKSIHFEQQAYEAEQMEEAIKALEKEAADPSNPTTISSLKGWKELNSSIALKGNAPLYQEGAEKENLLNTYIIRLNSLRKELTKMPIRYQLKSLFFKRLSAVGDLLFPARKAQLKLVESQFQADIDAFVQQNFTPNKLKGNFQELRSEIMLLQDVAKELPLSSKVFSNVRSKLSQCWDQLQKAIQLLRQERGKVQEQWKGVVDQYTGKIAEVAKKIDSEGAKLEEIDKEFEILSKQIRNEELGRIEGIHLKKVLMKAREPLDKIVQAKENQRVEKIKDKESARKAQVAGFTEQIKTHLESLEDVDLKSLEETLLQLPATAKEQETLKRSLHELSQALIIKREHELIKQISMSSGDDSVLIEEVLNLKVARLQALKGQLESLRKLSGSSGLGISESLQFQAQILEVRGQIDDLEVAIGDLVDQLGE